MEKYGIEKKSKKQVLLSATLEPFGESSVNKMANPRNNLASLTSAIKLRMHELHVDRIQFSVANRGGAGGYGLLERELGARLRSLGGHPVRGRYVRRFERAQVKVQLVSSLRNSFQFALAVSEPDAKTQYWLRTLFIRLGLAGVVSVSQAEFALDLYPAKHGDLYALGKVLSNYLVLNGVRFGSCTQIGETLYQGRGGNVRRGAKGLRCYPKPELGCYRVELQANRPHLRSMGIGVASLPIVPNHEDIFNHIHLRRGLTTETVRRLVYSIASQLKRKQGQHLNRMSKVNHLRSVQRFVLEGIVENGETSAVDLELQTARPVAVQIDHYRKLKAKYSLSCQTSQFFPMADIDQLVRDIQNGFIRREY